MTTEQLLGWFVGIAALGWVTLFAIVGWWGNAITKSINSIRQDLHKLATAVIPREEFDRRYTEISGRVEAVNRRVDDFWADLTDPGLGWPATERRRKPRE